MRGLGFCVVVFGVFLCVSYWFLSFVHVRGGEIV